MSWLRWRPGSAGGGYQKMVLLAVPSFLEVSLLRLKRGDEMEWHRDRYVHGFLETVVMLTLRKAREGGKVMTRAIVVDGEGREFKLTLRHKRRWVSFRPSAIEHGVSKVEEDSTLILHALLIRRSWIDWFIP